MAFSKSLDWFGKAWRTFKNPQREFYEWGELREFSWFIRNIRSLATFALKILEKISDFEKTMLFTQSIIDLIYQNGYTETQRKV
jgi:hypothetical protein